MAMVCPQCTATFEQRLHCPTCGVRLVYDTPGGSASGARPESAWQQTPWGRIFVGLLVAQGIFYGLVQFTNAGLLAVSGEGTNVWTTLIGLLVFQGFQLLGLLVGGALAGAGKREGVAYGAIVGVCNGLLSLFTLQYTPDLSSPVTLYGQPILHVVFGTLGGGLGLLIWKPPQALATLVPTGPSIAVSAGSGMPRALAGPIAWVRVAFGAVIAVCGTLWANAILEFMLEASEGRLTITSHLQAHLVTWEITALAMLGGSAIAGASTRNGLKQGLCVGLGAGVVLFVIRITGDPAPFFPIVLVATSAVVLGLVGGWFGGELFPPVLRTLRRKGVGSASV